MKPGFLCSVDNLPSYSCPLCDKGKIEPDIDSMIWRKTGKSIALEKDDYWEESFHRELLRVDTACSEKSCGEVGVIVMHGKLEPRHEGGAEQVLYTPKYISPAPLIFRIYDSYPNGVIEFSLQAFSLFWIDPAACGNKIRAAVERLLDDQGIECSKKDKAGNYILSDKGRPKPISLHQRLLLFKAKGNREQQCFNALDSIKWLGNSSSHQNEYIDKYTVYRALVIFGCILQNIYLSKELPDNLDYEIARVNVFYHPDEQSDWPK